MHCNCKVSLQYYRSEVGVVKVLLYYSISDFQLIVDRRSRTGRQEKRQYDPGHVHHVGGFTEARAGRCKMLNIVENCCSIVSSSSSRSREDRNAMKITEQEKETYSLSTTKLLPRWMI